MLDYAEHALSAGGDARAAAYVECEIGDRVLWGVGLDANIVTASLAPRAISSTRSPGWRGADPAQGPSGLGIVGGPGFRP